MTIETAAIALLHSLDRALALERDAVEKHLAECARTHTDPGKAYWENLHALRERRRVAQAFVDSIEAMEDSQ